MPILQPHNLHYRAVFEAQGDDSPGREVRHLVARWIGGKERKARDFLRGAAFTEGGRWDGPARGLRVATAQHEGSGSKDAPEFWALRFEHPCGSVRFRQWCVDVATTDLGDNRVLVSFGVSHWLRPEFIGEEPDRPLPSAPNVVREILNSTKLNAFGGSTALTTSPLHLAVGAGPSFQEMLVNPNRTVPIVYISHGEQSPLLNAASLARLLAATAVVAVADTPSLDEELAYFLRRNFSCWGGAVRVFHPGVQLRENEDAGRHRYFSAKRIEEVGPGRVEEMLVKAIHRRTRLVDSTVLATLDDIETRRRSRRIRDLRENATDEQREWFKEVDKENDDLRAQLKAMQGVETTLSEAEEALETARLDKEFAEKQQERERRRADEAEATVRAQARAFEEFADLPEGLPAMVDKIERIFAERLVFTEKAKKSAREAAINGAKSEQSTCWKLLWATATTLWDLHFDEAKANEPGALTDRFYEATGFRLTLTEGSMTKKDSGLANARKFTFEDEELDCSPHVKFGTQKPRILRLHYAPHGRTRRLVVNHCGDHLTTAGTRRRGES